MAVAVLVVKWKLSEFSMGWARRAESMPTGLGLELTCKLSEHSAGRLLEEGMGITGTPLTGDRLVLVATPSTGVDFVLGLELSKLSTEGTGSSTGVGFVLALKLLEVSTGRGSQSNDRILDWIQTSLDLVGGLQSLVSGNTFSNAERCIQ